MKENEPECDPWTCPFAETCDGTDCELKNSEAPDTVVLPKQVEDKLQEILDKK